MELIEEFEAIVAADPSGDWADDAQYAIGSCWIWLSKDSDPTSLQHAIKALEKLLKNYPDTPFAADAELLDRQLPLTTWGRGPCRDILSEDIERLFPPAHIGSRTV